MEIGLFLLAILCLSLQNVGYKLVSGYVNSERDTILFSSMIVSMVAVLSCLFTVQGFVWNGMTVLLGSVFGVFFALCEFSYMMALVTGPMSYTSLFLSCALVIPTLAGVMFWGEQMGAFQIMGILLLTVSFFFGLGKNGNEKKSNAKWLLFAVLTFVSNGMVSVMQKAQQLVVGDDQNGEFMVISFGTATVLLWGITLSLKRKKQNYTVPKKVRLKRVLPFAAGAAIASAAANQLVLYSAAKIDASVMFPVMNGGILILCSLTAAVFFKEKLTKKQWFGIAVGILSVLLISL